VTDITVDHLLTHTCGGWPADSTDPMYKSDSWDQAKLIGWTLENLPLANPPGEPWAFSNFGYCLLGRVIEQITGQPLCQLCAKRDPGALRHQRYAHSREQPEGARTQRSCVLWAIQRGALQDKRYPHGRERRMAGVLALILLATLVVGTSYRVNRKVAHLELGPFCLLWLVARMLEAYSVPGHIYSHLAPAAGLGLSCAALFIILHRFFSVSMVTRAMLAEAFVCYLIIAIAFSQLYLLLSRVVDHPFNEQIPVTQSSTFLYFSMDTLSGVGTGLIAPINPYIRLITGIENMIGIFYLAVVVSRLASSYRPRNRQQRHQPADQPIE
jgi:hypothetical protein